ncbi:hypothetical protein [Nitrospira sp. BLG_2]|uniref:hypothetical protein n=1 Tax=Nitrospira sp. BLG_2 TaxID=3397507 RepID=UPI003B99C1BF
MSYNEAETRFYLIDPILRGKGYNEHWKLKLETPAPVEPTGAKGRCRPGAGRTDYLLCVHIGTMLKPLPIAAWELAGLALQRGGNRIASQPCPAGAGS